MELNYFLGEEYFFFEKFQASPMQTELGFVAIVADFKVIFCGKIHRRVSEREAKPELSVLTTINLKSSQSKSVAELFDRTPRRLHSTLRRRELEWLYKEKFIRKFISTLSHGIEQSTGLGIIIYNFTRRGIIQIGNNAKLQNWNVFVCHFLAQVRIWTYSMYVGRQLSTGGIYCWSHQKLPRLFRRNFSSHIILGGKSFEIRLVLILEKVVLKFKPNLIYYVVQSNDAHTRYLRIIYCTNVYV